MLSRAQLPPPERRTEDPCVGKGFHRGARSAAFGRSSGVLLPGLYVPRARAAAPLHRADQGKRDLAGWEVRDPAVHVEAFL